MLTVEEKVEGSYNMHSGEFWCVNSYNSFLPYKKGYLDGYKQSYEDCKHDTNGYHKPKWHNIKQNPFDLPDECENVLCYCDGVGSGYYCVGHLAVTDEGLSRELPWWPNTGGNELFGVVAWCEIPKWKEQGLAYKVLRVTTKILLWVLVTVVLQMIYLLIV